MSDRFVVEANRQVVGVAVRVAGGYKFFSSDRALRGLEGRVFPRVRSMQRQVVEASRGIKPDGGVQ